MRTTILATLALTSLLAALGCGSTVHGGTGGNGGNGGSGGSIPGCRADADCAGPGWYCSPPGAMVCGDNCGANPVECSADADCVAGGATQICKMMLCGCADMKVCMPGCTQDADCALGETCGADHHCAAKACVDGTDCPVNFSCASQACARRACSADGDCAGACISGICYEAGGTCAEAG